MKPLNQNLSLTKNSINEDSLNNVRIKNVFNKIGARTSEDTWNLRCLSAGHIGKEEAEVCKNKAMAAESPHANIAAKTCAMRRQQVFGDKFPRPIAFQSLCPKAHLLVTVAE